MYKQGEMKSMSLEEQLQALNDIKDEDIDLSDIPELTEEFFENAEVVQGSPTKQRITIYLDEDIVDSFKSLGKGYQTKINQVLKRYISTSKNQSIAEETINTLQDVLQNLEHLKKIENSAMNKQT